MTPPEKVTTDSFVAAETARYFREQLGKAPVNSYFHNRVPINVENQVIIRSNVDLIYSYAVIDVSEEATFSVAPSDEYQVDQIIDENHYIAGVVYPGETLTLTKDDLTGGSHVYILGRTSTEGGLDRATELQDLRNVESKTRNPYVSAEYEEESLDQVKAELEARAAEADFSLAFGTPESTDPGQHVLGAALGWGGLSPQHAQYYQALATSSGCDVWSFDVPPLDYDHNGYFSVIKYDETGWLDVERPGLAGREIERDDNGTVSIFFGEGDCAGKNLIETKKGQRFYYGIRLYRPLDVDKTRRFIEGLKTRPIEPGGEGS